MKKNYFLTLLLTLCFSVISYAQTTLKFQDFEGGSDDWAFTLDPATYNTSGDVWANVTTVGGAVTSPQNGANFWGMRDLENSNGGSANDHTLTFANVDVSGKTGVEISFHYITDGFDSSDYLKVEIFHDDVSQGVEELDKNTDAWTLYAKSVPDGVNNVRVTIIAKQNGSTDYAGVDNFKVRDGVAASCGFAFGNATATCNTFTGGVDTSDTYNISIPFTGGVAGLSVSTSSGTVGGDDPATNATGTITISNVAEGTNVTITVAGGVCNEDLVVNSPNNCVVPKTLPIYESFSNTVGSNLSSDPYWINSGSGDEILLATPTITNPFTSAQFPDPTGNMVKFDGSGNDTYTVFPNMTSGTIYTSFIFKVTDMTVATNANGGYFAVLNNDNFAFAARLWIKQDTDNTRFVIGGSSGSTANNYSSTTHAAGEEVFIVMSYDFGTDMVKIWENPDPADFEAGTAPTATLSFAGSTPSNLDRFLLRQDSSTETPEISFDELRIATSWAEVTPKGAAASVEKNNIEGFTTYPNPVNNGRLTITTSSASEKEVTIFNVLGKRVYSQKFTGTNKQLDVSQIKSGIYIMKVVEDKKVATKKLVIK